MSSKKTNVLSTLSSFNTLLNDFPSLLSVNVNETELGLSTVIEFLLNIASMLGMTEKKILNWVSGLLTEVENGVSAVKDSVKVENSTTQSGILSVIEEAVKAILLLHFNSLYGCETQPIIPDDFLRYSYSSFPQHDGNGAKIKLPSIDMFSQLRFYPLGETGQLFYFDTNAQSVAQPRYLYRSCDFNAWLWWIINYSNQNSFEKFPWDNRVYYKKKFNGNDGDQNRIRFISATAESQFYEVAEIGHKKNIISAKYVEEGRSLKDSNMLYVYGCAETYKGTGLLGLNKTIFEFNADYIYSLKLFDSKTVVAQIINAIMGLSGAMFSQISLELNILVKKIEKTVDKVISMPIKKEDPGYYTFSEEEYNDIVKDATLRYNGQYETRNETDELVTLDVTELTNAIKKIDSATNTKEKQEAIIYALTTLGETTTEFNFGINTQFVAGKDIITRFIKEIITQISMQVLSPKVMLLFAINDYFLNNEKDTTKIDISGFMDSFWNIITSCIIKISELILQSLMDLVIGFIRPILALVVEKLLLETLMYYKELLQQLLGNCTLALPTFNLSTSALAIDNVNYADIIPTKTTPDK